MTREYLEVATGKPVFQLQDHWRKRTMSRVSWISLEILSPKCRLAGAVKHDPKKLPRNKHHLWLMISRVRIESYTYMYSRQAKYIPSLNSIFANKSVPYVGYLIVRSSRSLWVSLWVDLGDTPSKIRYVHF